MNDLNHHYTVKISYITLLRGYRISESCDSPPCCCQCMQSDHWQPGCRYGFNYPHCAAHDSRSEVGSHADPCNHWPLIEMC